MAESSRPTNTLLLQGAALWLLVSLMLAWCLVGLNFGAPVLPAIFPGKITRLVQAHLDLLLMSALLFGFHAAKIPLPRLVCWAMFIGAFANSSLFLLQAAFGLYAMTGVTITSYGFGRAAVLVLRSRLSAEQKP